MATDKSIRQIVIAIETAQRQVSAVSADLRRSATLSQRQHYAEKLDAALVTLEQARIALRVSA